MFKRNLRTDKNCLNCSSPTAERFCPNCGQENIQPKLPIGDLLKELVKQVFDIDGRFYKTIKHLFTKPGEVAREYTTGKRKTYTHPVRLFFVFGAIFLVAFNLEVDINAIASEQAAIEATKKGVELNSLEYNQLFQVQKKTYSSLFGSLVYIIIFSVALFAFLSKIFLRSKNNYYYVDYIIYAMYNYILYFIPFTLILIFYHFLNSDNPKDNKWGFFLFLAIVLSYGTVAARQFLGYSKIKSALAGFFQLVFLIISVVAAVITVMIVLFTINYIPLELLST